jgi:hypothetical protein
MYAFFLYLYHAYFLAGLLRIGLHFPRFKPARLLLKPRWSLEKQRNSIRWVLPPLPSQKLLLKETTLQAYAKCTAYRQRRPVVQPKQPKVFSDMLGFKLPPTT